MLSKLAQLKAELQAQSLKDRPRVFTSKLVSQTLSLSAAELREALTESVPFQALYTEIGELLVAPLAQRWPNAVSYLKEKTAPLIG